MTDTTKKVKAKKKTPKSKPSNENGENDVIKSEKKKKKKKKKIVKKDSSTVTASSSSSSPASSSSSPSSSSASPSSSSSSSSSSSVAVPKSQEPKQIQSDTSSTATTSETKEKGNDHDRVDTEETEEESSSSSGGGGGGGEDDMIDPSEIEEVIELGDEQNQEKVEEEEGGGDGMDDVQEDGGDGEGEREEKEDIKDDSLASFRLHKESIHSIAINPEDETMILTGSQDDTACLWRIVYETDQDEKKDKDKELEDKMKDVSIEKKKPKIKETKELWHLKGHKDTVVGVGFSSDGKLCGSASMDGSIRIYKTQTGTLVHTLTGPDELLWMDWHPNGPVVIGGAQDTSVWMWNAQSGKMMQCFMGHRGAVTCGGFSADGKTICTASEDASLIVWNPKTGKSVHHIEGGGLWHQKPIHALAQHPTQSLVLTGDEDGICKLTNITTGKVVSEFKGHTKSVESANFCAKLKIAATGSIDNTVKIWDLTTAQCRTTLNHEDSVIKVKWHATDPLLYSCSADRTTRLWDGRTGKCVRMWSGHHDSVLDFAVSRDGRVVVTSSDDSTARIFLV